MTSAPPFIIDAGPALNFLASGHEQLLSRAVGNQAVHAPETVEDEVLRKSRNTSKFRGAEGRWRRMKPNWLQLLPDDSQNPLLRQAAQDLLPTSLAVRQRDGNDLGETMVVLHAYAQAMTGQTVVVIIDDKNGRQFALKASNRIAQAQQVGTTSGRVYLTSTTDLISQRLNTPDIPDLDSLHSVWGAISSMDDGLAQCVPDRLLTSQKWNGPPRP